MDQYKVQGEPLVSSHSQERVFAIHTSKRKELELLLKTLFFDDHLAYGYW